MVTFCSILPNAIVIIFLLLLTHSPITAHSQISGEGTPPPPGPTVGECGPRLFALAPCGPFVQGTVPSPVQACCDSLRQQYSQQPGCLCLLLNDTNLSSLPINTTLALQLPLLCSLQVDFPSCSGESSLPPGSPDSQVSFGSKGKAKPTNSTMAAAPVVTVTPRPGIMGFGIHRSAAGKVTDEARKAAVVAAVAAAAASMSSPFATLLY